MIDLAPLYILLHHVEKGDFYDDYDEASATLVAARQALNDIDEARRRSA